MKLMRADVVALIEKCLAGLNSERPEDDQIPIAEDTPLLGGGAKLDSLAFVAFVADLEEQLQAAGCDLVLVGELDGSADHPFRSVAALADRIVELSAAPAPE